MFVFVLWRNRREQWHLFSSYASWQHLVAQTKRQARDHAILSDIYANTVIQRLGQVTEEVQRIYRRVSNHLLNFYFSFCKKKNKAISGRVGRTLSQLATVAWVRLPACMVVKLFPTVSFLSLHHGLRQRLSEHLECYEPLPVILHRLGRE